VTFVMFGMTGSNEVAAFCEKARTNAIRYMLPDFSVSCVWFY
jgi:hypothetical protein